MCPPVLRLVEIRSKAYTVQVSNNVEEDEDEEKMRTGKTMTKERRE